MKENLLLGLGSSILADQSIVLKLIHMLKPEFENVLDFDTALISSLDLIEVIKDYRHLLILDTVQQCEMPQGKICFSDITTGVGIHTENYHDSSVIETIQIAELLKMPVPQKISIVTINVQDIYSLNEQFSQELNQLLPDICLRLRAYLHKFFELKQEASLVVE